MVNYLKRGKQKPPENELQKSFSSVHVMVHPLFSVAYPSASLNEPSEAVLKKLEVKKHETLGHYIHPKQVGAHLDLLYRFYLKQLERIRRRPGALLVFVQARNPPFEGELYDLEKYGFVGKDARRIYDRHQAFAKELRKRVQKLGKRAIVTRVEPFSVGRAVKKEMAVQGISVHPQAPIEVFGEFRFSCVNDVNTSLREAGFVNTQVIHSKSY